MNLGAFRGGGVPAPVVVPTRATVITDAAFCPSTKAAAWAAWITLNTGGGTFRVKACGVFKVLPGNSTEAEWRAYLNGIHMAYQRGARVIVAQSDCLSVVRSARPIRNINAPGYPQSRRGMSFPVLCAAMFPEARIIRRHVKGHTTKEDPRFYVNRWCDHEAKRLMRRLRDAIRAGEGQEAIAGAVVEVPARS